MPRCISCLIHSRQASKIRKDTLEPEEATQVQTICPWLPACLGVLCRTEYRESREGPL